MPNDYRNGERSEECVAFRDIPSTPVNGAVGSAPPLMVELRAPRVIENPPIPPLDKDDAASNAEWIVHFFHWFIKAWSDFESTFEPFCGDEGFIATERPPVVLLEEAPKLLGYAADTVLRFSGVWVFEAQYPPQDVARHLRMTRNYFETGGFQNIGSNLPRAATPDSLTDDIWAIENAIVLTGKRADVQGGAGAGPGITYIDRRSYQVGDKFENIVNSPIANRVSAGGSISQATSSPELAGVLKQLTELVVSSQNDAAKQLLNEFKAELEAQTPQNGRLRTLGERLVKTLPTVTSLMNLVSTVLKMKSGTQ